MVKRLTVLKRFRALVAAGAAVVIDSLVGAGCARFQILRIGVLLIEHVCCRGERGLNDCIFLNVGVAAPAVKRVVVRFIGIIIERSRRGGVLSVFHLLRRSDDVSVLILERHRILVDREVKLCRVGCWAGNGGNHRIPVISAVGVLRVVRSGRRRAAVDRRCAVFDFIRVKHGAVPVFPGNRVFVDGAVIWVVLVVDRVIGHVACAERGQGIERCGRVRVGVPADGGVGVLRVRNRRHCVFIDRYGADHGLCGTGKRFVAVFPCHGHIAVIQGVVVRACGHGFRKRHLGVPALVGIGGRRPADKSVIRVGVVAEGRVFRRGKGLAVGIGLRRIRRVGIAVIEVDGIGVQIQRVCGDRRVTGDGDLAAVCNGAAVHLQHRCGLVIAGLCRSRHGDSIAPGIGAVLNAGNRCAGTRGHGHRV